MTDVEDNITHKIYSIFKEHKIEVEKQKKVGRGHIDLFVTFESFTIAVECKKEETPNAKKAVLEDAVGRLVPNANADIAFSIIYPKGTTEENLTETSEIIYAKVDKEFAIKYKRELTNPSIQWHKRNVKDFIFVLNKAEKDVGDPNELIMELEKSLNRAADRLSKENIESISTLLDLESSKISAKRALLLIASASMFHARLDPHIKNLKPNIDDRSGKPFKDKWPPNTLSQCVNSANVRNDLLKAWNLILAVDYKPIFVSACSVLQAGSGSDFVDSIKDVSCWASNAVDQVAGMRHDILGRIFHKVLETAKHDGSFYTSISASVLLTGLAIRTRNDIPKNLSNMRVIDAACGTGTLLMATAERIKDVMKKENYDANTIIEDILYGLDINITALHMAATTLGLLSPKTQFKKMNIHKMPFGKVVNGVKIGSLELCADDTLQMEMPWYESRDKGEQIDAGNKVVDFRFKKAFDLVIMNPPFTRGNLKNKQFDSNVTKQMKKQESKILKQMSNEDLGDSSGLFFNYLSIKLVKEGGTIALIGPLSMATAPSAFDIRKYFSQNFHIETIVVSHDPKRFWFSENTAISEMLLIMRKTELKKPTKIVHLEKNPNSATEATEIVNKINNHDSNMNIISVPYDIISKGDWSATQFYSPKLVSEFMDIKNGNLFEIERFGKIAKIVLRLDAGTFDLKDTPTSDGWRTLYGHQTNYITSLQVKPNKYLHIRKGKEKQAKQFWDRRTTFLLTTRVQPNITHCNVVNVNTPTIGVGWYVVKYLGKLDSELWYKAMTVYLNSTLGTVTIFGIRKPFKLLYPGIRVKQYTDMPIPRFSKNDIIELAETYDKHATKTIGQFRSSDDPIRIALDKVVCKVLKVNYEKISSMRNELSREPMCTGKQYGTL